MRYLLAVAVLGTILLAWIAYFIFVLPAGLLWQWLFPCPPEQRWYKNFGESAQPREQQQVSHCNAGSEREPPKRA